MKPSCIISTFFPLIFELESFNIHLQFYFYFYFLLCCEINGVSIEQLSIKSDWWQWVQCTCIYNFKPMTGQLTMIWPRHFSWIWLKLSEVPSSCHSPCNVKFHIRIWPVTVINFLYISNMDTTMCKMKKYTIKIGC